MNISNLPIGTKLMWDAPLPFEGYKSSSLDPNRILYTALIVDRAADHPKGTKVRINTNHWMGDTDDHLRLPTEKELKTYNWPTL